MYVVVMSDVCVVFKDWLRARSYVSLINVLNIRIFAAHLQALLFSAHPLEQRLNVMLHGVVDEFVLGLCLYHARTLRSDHLNGALDIDFGVQAVAFDLIEYHVDDNERAGAANASRAVNADGSLFGIDVRENGD